MTPQDLPRCIETLRADFARAEIVYRRENRAVVRCWQGGASVILKLWSRPDWKGTLRRLARLGSCEHELRSLRRLSAAGVPVPAPLGLVRLSPALAGYTDALAMEDLGSVERASGYLTRLVKERREDEALRFEDAVIEMTARIVQAGVLDVDHGFANIVVQASGRPVRLDVELARRVLWPRAFPDMYGRMLGHLIALHAFAVQPQTGRSTEFARRLVARLRPPAAALPRAAAYVRLGMKMQADRKGMATAVSLPWE